MSNITGRPIFQKGQGAPKEKPKGVRKVSKKRAKEKHPLRENAKGKDCTFKFSGCRNDPAYTVLCHLRRFGWAGAGQKPIDILGAFGCDFCHDKQENHHPEATDTELLRAMGQTQIIQTRDGLIKF